MRRLTISLLVIIISVLQASAYKKQSIDVTVNGQKRNMVVFTPKSFPKKSPLFIVTHGMNQDPEYQYGSDKMYEMIDTAKFVIAYLRSDGSTWDTGGTKDQNFVTKTIDVMVDSFDIDRDRVYWSGFSMGSMLIHHCIANMQDKIAAFAPTSGIQFSESPWNNCSKPVNLLECIAYGDDVFGYEQYGIHDYIENYAKHDNHTNYSKTTGYKPISSSWYDGDLEKWTGGTNGGEVWLYSYNNGGHWPMDLNRHLIWNFCKRFILGQPLAKIIEPAGDATYVCMAPSGKAVYPEVTVTAKATAKTTGSKIEKLELYDGKTLVDSANASNFTTKLPSPAKTGKHTLRVVAQDSKGKTGETTRTITYYAPATASFSMHSTFKTEGVIPQNWQVSNGNVNRVGGNGKVYTSGNRLLKFTNSSKAFTYGLLVQNASTKAKGAWARFGASAGRSHLTLNAGRYAVKYKVCNWNRPQFSPVTVAVENSNGEEVASQVYTPTVNIGNDVSKSFSGVALQTFTFDIPEDGDYVISFYADGTKNADFVLGSASIQAQSYVATGIENVNLLQKPINNDCYDLSGRRVSEGTSKPGLYIKNGRKVVIKRNN